MNQDTTVFASEAIVNPAPSMDPGPWFPTANWCGRLILPSREERKDDGSVFFEILQAPETATAKAGQKVRIRLEAEWTERVSDSVKFDILTKASVKNGMVHPERLNGWDRVSPMESLAGARPTDDVLVELVDPEEDGDTLVIEKEPIQISGSLRALARFQSQNDDGSWSVRHWDRETSDFTGPEEDVVVAGRESLDPTGGDKLNAEGWYLYGDINEKGRKVIRGLEPRGLFRLQADKIYSGRDEALRFIKYRNWDKTDMVKGSTERIFLSQASLPEGKVKIGDKALVLDLFGAIKGRFLRLAGHFSFGVAEVTHDPITGEPKLEVEHKQIYVHNIDGLIPGSSRWHCYMGDTGIGKLAIRPNCDYLVFFPTLFDDSKGESAYTVFERRLAEMTARYRTGEGDGLTRVTAAQNCSQDSAGALYAAICDWQKLLDDGKLPDEIGKLIKLLKKHITPLAGWAPLRWRRMAKRQRAKTSKLRIIPALISYKTILPRCNADGLAELAAKSECPMHLLRTEIVGSTDEDLQPYPPVRPRLLFWR